MSKKQKTIEIILASGRRAIIATPEKAVSPVPTKSCSYLGRWKEWGMFETPDLKMAIVKLPIESIVKGIGPATLEQMIVTTNLTATKAVAMNLAKFITTLPENGFLIPCANVHEWVEELTEETTEEGGEETTEDELM